MTTYKSHNPLLTAVSNPSRGFDSPKRLPSAPNSHPVHTQQRPCEDAQALVRGTACPRPLLPIPSPLSEKNQVLRSLFAVVDTAASTYFPATELSFRGMGVTLARFFSASLNQRRWRMDDAIKEGWDGIRGAETQPYRRATPGRTAEY